MSAANDFRGHCAGLFVFAGGGLAILSGFVTRLFVLALEVDEFDLLLGDFVCGGLFAGGLLGFGFGEGVLLGLEFRFAIGQFAFGVAQMVLLGDERRGALLECLLALRECPGLIGEFIGAALQGIGLLRERAGVIVGGLAARRGLAGGGDQVRLLGAERFDVAAQFLSLRMEGALGVAECGAFVGEFLLLPIEAGSLVVEIGFVGGVAFREFACPRIEIALLGVQYGGALGEIVGLLLEFGGAVFEFGLFGFEAGAALVEGLARVLEMV